MHHPTDRVHPMKDRSDDPITFMVIWRRIVKIDAESHMHHPTDRITHITAFVTPVVEHWREREIADYDGG